MHPNAALLTRFYQAFAQRDWQTMAACYTPDARFDDPAFSLRGAQIGGMWRMLCTNARDFSLQFSEIDADDANGRAHWEPRYTFSATGRAVHNIIDSRFEFRDGLICAQRDHFDFWRWSRQALGAPGLLLGWSNVLRNKVRAQAGASLDKFLAKIDQPAP